MKNLLNLPLYSTDLELLKLDLDVPLILPFIDSKLSAGFPSPAEDYLINSIDIMEYITQHPVDTFFFRVTGDSLIDAHIPEESVIAVDKSLKPDFGQLIVAIVYNEFTVKRLMKKGNQVYLKPENKKYQPIIITEEMNFRVWGRVVTVFHKV